MLLAQKTTVIYGAGGAIGGAVARAFAHEGHESFSPVTPVGHSRPWLGRYPRREGWRRRRTSTRSTSWPSSST